MTCSLLRARLTSANTRWIPTLSSCPITSSRERHMAKAKAKKSKTKTKTKAKKAAPKKSAKPAAKAKPKAKAKAKAKPVKKAPVKKAAPKPAKAKAPKPAPPAEPQMDEAEDHHAPIGMGSIGIGAAEPDHWQEPTSPGRPQIRRAHV